MLPRDTTRSQTEPQTEQAFTLNRANTSPERAFSRQLDAEDAFSRLARHLDRNLRDFSASLTSLNFRNPHAADVDSRKDYYIDNTL